MKKILLLLASVVIGTVIIFVFLNLGNSVPSETTEHDFFVLPESPLDGSFKVGEREVQLTDGKYENEDVSVETVLGPEFGDISGDGEDDAVLVLRVTESGSETLYLVPAMHDDGGYLGFEATELEKSEVPERITVSDLFVTLSYREESSPQPSFTEEHYSLMGVLLRNSTPKSEDTIYKGYYIYGHESRTFTECGSGEVYWIAPESQSRAALEAVYSAQTVGLEPYAEVYVVVTGHVVEAPSDGFGAEYEKALMVESIVSVPEDGACIEEGGVSEE